jgi:coenzyme F420-dependent glucose-6-phosphate dehydrogenase
MEEGPVSVRIGFHASHEQFPPSHLLRLVQRCAEAGFEEVQSSDHIEPWGVDQGESGFAFAWLGAAMQSISLPFTVVTAPGGRYHPAIVAQAIATLAEMFPDRFSVALGSGEAMNEHITGSVWPPKEMRNDRLGECVDIIRRLLAGERVTHEGLVTVHEAKVWSLPDKPPPLMAAALSPETARWAGSWGDGLITVNQPEDTLRRIIEAFRERAGDKPLMLQAHLSWAESEEEAVQAAHRQWRGNVFPGLVAQDLRLAEQFDAAAMFVRPEDMRKSVDISADPNWHADNLARYRELGFTTVFCHNVGENQEAFIDVFGDKVLPQLRRAT